MAWKMILGLGNPGKEYENTYHNAGLIALERIVQDLNPENADFRRHGDFFSYFKVNDVIFVRPLVFMNESGLAARGAADAFDIAPEEILVLHDESDLPIGEYKISKGGGAAGHKGIQSIIDHLKSESFSRARIGIRNPNEIQRKKAGDFVLQTISKEDVNALQTVFDSILDALRSEGVS